jgi:hypothetical protein
MILLVLFILIQNYNGLKDLNYKILVELHFKIFFIYLFTVCLTTLSVGHNVYFPGIPAEGFRKTAKKLSQDSRWPGRSSFEASSEYLLGPRTIDFIA